MLTQIALLTALGTVTAAPLLQQRDQAKGNESFAVTQDFPGVPFQIPASYAGLLPISNDTDSDQELFFWYYPHTADVGADDLLIWLNGGPGCSSLEGALQENGPWLLPWNTTDVVENPYSWTNLSNIVYIEQPVGTGFTSGDVTAQNELDVADQFIGFLKNFYSTFTELQGKKLWLTGESYAGKYIPYIASGIYNMSESDAAELGIDLRGIHILDPSFTQDTRGFGQDLTAVDYAQSQQEKLGLNDTFLNALVEEAKENGLYNFTEQHLSYPPNGHIYAPDNFSQDFKPWNSVYYAAFEANPCFDVYDIRMQCPSITDRLGFAPDANQPSANNFLNNQTGLKEALHLPESKIWYECSPEPVFVGEGDASPPPDQTVLAGVIEKSQRAMISHGILDYILLHQGSALAIQNLTWSGQQGFQTAPSKEFKVEGQTAGMTHTERNLTFTTVQRSGHMVPQDYPAAGYKLTQFLLGQVDSLD